MDSFWHFLFYQSGTWADQSMIIINDLKPSTVLDPFSSVNLNTPHPHTCQVKQRCMRWSVCKEGRKDIGCLSVCLSIFLSVCLTVSLTVFLSVCLTISLSDHLSVCLTISLSVRVFGWVRPSETPAVFVWPSWEVSAFINGNRWREGLQAGGDEGG